MINPIFRVCQQKYLAKKEHVDGFCGFGESVLRVPLSGGGLVSTDISGRG